MPNFGIYYFQFTYDDGLIKKFNSTVIGQVCLQSARYTNMSVKEACLFRIKQQLSLQKNIPIDPLSKITNYGFYHINTMFKKRGVDTLIRNIITQLYNIPILLTKTGTKTEVMNLQSLNCQQVLDNAVSKLVGYDIKLGGKHGHKIIKK